MYGKNIGSLNIYSQSESDGHESILFRKSYEVGDYWERLEIKLNETQTFRERIIIEGVVGNGYLGNIAIDDITFTSGCIFNSTQEFSTIITQAQTTTTPIVCLNSFKCVSDLKCLTFEKVCNFINDCEDSSDEGIAFVIILAFNDCGL